MNIGGRGNRPARDADSNGNTAAGQFLGMSTPIAHGAT
ncbi:hypothetical protein I545_5867 [Mycobacterium kansasii 662]|uniref:Uncharacterized protein n=1 Tax=Mycobacterium kansasii 662 TaxID=1299326 RepID=X7YTY7_MYCKA|nr:hypothetical protein I545_5867 [Mycobacterium kansasii 662]